MNPLAWCPALSLVRPIAIPDDFGTPILSQASLEKKRLAEFLDTIDSESSTPVTHRYGASTGVITAKDLLVDGSPGALAITVRLPVLSSGSSHSWTGTGDQVK